MGVPTKYSSAALYVNPMFVLLVISLSGDHIKEIGDK